jgi:acetyl esterase/lipase
VDISTLDEEVAAAIAFIPARQPLSLESLPGRRGESALWPAVTLSDDVERTDHEVRADGPRLRVHRPAGVDGPLPCLYWMHGGGLVLGNHLQDDLRFDGWCRRHRMMAVSVDYRLAPETRYPGALDDCHDGLQWVADNADALGIDSTRIGIGGVSSGSGLAAALALLVRDRRSVGVTFQLLIYPMLDDRRATVSSNREDVPIWKPSDNAFGWRCYLGDLVATDAVETYAAAARATDLGGLAPAFVSVGNLDGFLDEDIDYATRLMQAGVPTDLRVYGGLPHGFESIAPGASACKRAQRDIDEWLERALEWRLGN